MKIQALRGRCLFCGRLHGSKRSYDPNGRRYHCTKGLGVDVKKTFGQDIDIYPTIYPEPQNTGGFVASPHATPPVDGLAIASPTLDKLETVEAEVEGLPALPYGRAEELAHLRCGNPTLYNLGGAATSFGFSSGSIYVCDMATYPWSNTLKDPRSWAVINTAINTGIRHLGVWTAGNAGLSLAKLAYVANRLLPLAKRLQVYCYSYQEALSPFIKNLFTCLGAKHINFYEPPSGSIFQVHQILSQINNYTSPQLEPDAFWEVTDGNDGLGLYMYRLIGRQLCSYLRPQYIVAPLGTGDLFYGLWLGRADCVNRGIIDQTECRMVGAVPACESNILRNYAKSGFDLPIDIPAGSVAPIAPKLETIYTPLLLVMYRALLQADHTQLLLVTKPEQLRAATVLRELRNDLSASSEPSALVGFAALPKLAEKHTRQGNSGRGLAATSVNARVVVVNSGFGILDEQEQEFLSSLT